MKCPSCNFVSSNKRDICPNCDFDLRPHKIALGLPISSSITTKDQPKTKQPTTAGPANKPLPAIPPAQKVPPLQVGSVPTTTEKQPVPSAPEKETKKTSWFGKLLTKDSKTSPPKQSQAPTAKPIEQPTAISATKQPQQPQVTSPIVAEEVPATPPSIPATIEPNSGPNEAEILPLTIDLPDSLEHSAEHAELESEAFFDIPEPEPILDASPEPLPEVLGIEVAEPPPSNRTTLSDLAREVQGANDLESEQDAVHSGSPTPFVSPEVIVFGEDDALFEQKLDEMIGDVTFDVEAVKTKSNKPQVITDNNEADTEYVVEHDLELDFQLNLPETTDNEEQTSPPPSPAKIISSLAVEGASDRDLIWELASLLGELYGVTPELLLGRQSSENIEEIKLDQVVPEAENPSAPVADGLEALIAEENLDDDIADVFREVSLIAETIKHTEDDIFNAVSNRESSLVSRAVPDSALETDDNIALDSDLIQILKEAESLIEQEPADLGNSSERENESSEQEQIHFLIDEEPEVGEPTEETEKKKF